MASEIDPTKADGHPTQNIPRSYGAFFSPFFLLKTRTNSNFKFSTCGLKVPIFVIRNSAVPQFFAAVLSNLLLVFQVIQVT